LTNSKTGTGGTALSPVLPYNTRVVKEKHPLLMKNYRIQVTTFDGLRTIWYEKSKAKKATDIICRRVYEQLCGLNIKEIDVTLSV